MTGSDSNSSSSSGSWNSGGTTACDSIAFETSLSSPKPNIISQISVGDLLEISLIMSNGIELVAALYNGQIAGGLVTNSHQLKECINQGFSYQADVREINGALVKVFITRV